jgi:hypothetical protein
MVLSTGLRHSHQEDEELSLDRAPVGSWRMPQPVEARPGLRGPDPIGTVSSLVGLGLKLTVLLFFLMMLWAFAGFVGIGGSATNGVGARISSAIDRGAATAAGVGQRVADAIDRAHPPRGALTQDVEIDELVRVNIGAPLPGATTRAVTVASVQRRDGAETSDTAMYAVLRSELRQPNETKILGVTVRSTTEPRDDYVYKGETIRIGPKLYKVNWISAERKQIALIAYRDQDRVTAAVKAAFD